MIKLIRTLDVYRLEDDPRQIHPKSAPIQEFKKIEYDSGRSSIDQEILWRL